MSLCFLSRARLPFIQVNRVSSLTCAQGPAGRRFIAMQNENENGKESGENGPQEGNAVDDSRTVTPHVAAKRRERPPLRYTEDFATPSTVSLDVIGVVRSPYKVSFCPKII